MTVLSFQSALTVSLTVIVLGQYACLLEMLGIVGGRPPRDGRVVVVVDDAPATSTLAATTTRSMTMMTTTTTMTTQRSTTGRPYLRHREEMSRYPQEQRQAASDDDDGDVRANGEIHGDIRSLPPSQRIDVVYGGHGSHSGFLSELKASLKSVLLNAPLDMPLNIHFLVDEEAQAAIQSQILDEYDLSTWKSRQPITINTYNVESLVPRWMAVVNDTYRHFPPDMDWYRHTAGAYFRLFADEVLPSHVENFLYMDSDVVVMSNLQALWKQVGSRSAHFQWGQELCSGFLVIQKNKLKDFWARLQDYDIVRLNGYTVHQAQKRVRQKGLGDQFLMRAMNATEPHLIDVLPPEWDVSANDGPWWQRNGTGLEQDRESGIGMLHFNGGGASKESAFVSHLFLAPGKNNNQEQQQQHQHQGNELEFPTTWGLAHYYDRLPWNWAKYMVESYSGPSDDQSGSLRTNNHGITIHHYQGGEAAAAATMF